MNSFPIRRGCTCHTTKRFGEVALIGKTVLHSDVARESSQRRSAAIIHSQSPDSKSARLQAPVRVDDLLIICKKVKANWGEQWQSRHYFACEEVRKSGFGGEHADSNHRLM